MNRIAEENHLPLEEPKHEQLVLRTKKRKKSADVKWVKWIRIIMDETLSFDKHWQSRKWEQKMIEIVPEDRKVLVVSDSQAAIAAVREAGKTGRAGRGNSRRWWKR